MCKVSCIELLSSLLFNAVEMIVRDQQMENQLVSLGAKFGAAQDQASRQEEIKAAYERTKQDNLNL